MNTLIGNDIVLAKKYLDSYNIVAIPTETVYGLAANALSAEAVAKIYEVKNRPQFNPLILHIASVDEISKYVTTIPDKIYQLVNRFMPGALTILLPKKDIVPDLVTAGSSQVAIRIPKHSTTLALLELLDYPLAAPSANPSGYVSPTSAQHVLAGLDGKIPYILDGGECEIGLESTIIGYNFKTDKVILHRLGGLEVGIIEAVLGEKIEESLQHSSPETPGQLKSHYATQTPLYLGHIEEMYPQFSTKKGVVINFSQTKPISVLKQFVLSTKGDTTEAAQKLFATLREADALGVDYILAEYAPDLGLGRAINDRLKRAQFINI